MPKFPATTIQGLPDRIGTPDTALNSGDFTLLAKQTAGLAFRMCGNSMNWIWTGKATAPKCTISAASTSTPFTLSSTNESVTFQIPWQVQNQYTGIRCMVGVIGTKSYPAQFRLVADDLVDAVATTTGAWSESIVPVLHHSRVTQFLDPIVWRSYKITYYIEPTLPASNQITIQPEIQVVPSAVFGQSGDAVFYLTHMALVDVYDETY